MKLQQAIEILKETQMNFADHIDADTLNAIQLGIEALKALDLCRRGVSAQVYLLLPGETKH